MELPKHVFFEGNIVPFDKARVSVATHAFNYGTAVFGGIRGYWNEEAKKLCKEIREKHPDLCVGLDFTFRENGEHIEIDEWNSSKPRPRG